MHEENMQPIVFDTFSGEVPEHIKWLRVLNPSLYLHVYVPTKNIWTVIARTKQPDPAKYGMNIFAYYNGPVIPFDMEGIRPPERVINATPYESIELVNRNVVMCSQWNNTFRSIGPHMSFWVFSGKPGAWRKVIGSKEQTQILRDKKYVISITYSVYEPEWVPTYSHE